MELKYHSTQKLGRRKQTTFPANSWPLSADLIEEQRWRSSRRRRWRNNYFPVLSSRPRRRLAGARAFNKDNDNCRGGVVVRPFVLTPADKFLIRRLNWLDCNCRCACYQDEAGKEYIPDGARGKPSRGGGRRGGDAIKRHRSCLHRKSVGIESLPAAPPV